MVAPKLESLSFSIANPESDLNPDAEKVIALLRAIGAAVLPVQPKNTRFETVQWPLGAEQYAGSPSDQRIWVHDGPIMGGRTRDVRVESRSVEGSMTLHYGTDVKSDFSLGATGELANKTPAELLAEAVVTAQVMLDLVRPTDTTE